MESIALVFVLVLVVVGRGSDGRIKQKRTRGNFKKKEKTKGEGRKSIKAAPLPLLLSPISGRTPPPFSLIKNCGCHSPKLVAFLTFVLHKSAYGEGKKASSKVRAQRVPKRGREK